MSTPVVTREKNRLVLETDFELKNRVKELPGRLWDEDRKRWHVPATQETVLAIREKLGDVRCDRATLELFAAAAEAEEARNFRFAEDLPPIPGLPPHPMNPEGGGWNHQRQAYWFALPQESSALVMAMGTGKSLVKIKLYEAWQADVVVIVCPSKARKIWPREFGKWGERKWIVENGRNILGARGKPKKKPSLPERVEAMEKAMKEGADQKRPVALVVNYEAFWQGAMRTFLLSLKGQLDVVDYDEIHKIKRAGGKWSRMAEQLSKRAKRKGGLTGTLIPHSEPDVYGQYRALDPGIFGTNFKRFKDKYFEMGGFEMREVQGFLDEAKETDFQERLQRIAYFCGEDVLDLPPSVDMPPVTFEMGAKAAKAYREMESDFVSWIGEADSTEITAANVLAKMTRLQQITSGYLPVGDDGEIEILGNEKQKLLIDELEDIPTHEPVVVYARFTEDLKRIEEAAKQTGRRYREISGRRDDGLIENPDDPSADGTMVEDCDLLGCQIQAVAEAVDLTRSCYGIFYTLNRDLGNFKQVRKRQDRPGQTRSVRYAYLGADGTMDEVIIAALAARDEVTSAVIKAARERGRLSVD